MYERKVYHPYLHEMICLENIFLWIKRVKSLDLRKKEILDIDYLVKNGIIRIIYNICIVFTIGIDSVRLNTRGPEVTMSTLRELSEKTGYSSATISRILNGDPTLSVTEETRRIVLEAAGRMNYIATRSKRGRTPKKSFRVGVAEERTPVEQLDDPYYLYLSNYVRQGCQDKNYTYIPLERRGDTFNSRNAGNLSGIVAIGMFSPNQVKQLSALSPNVVFLDTSPMESRFDSVVPGYELGISLAVEHLLELNHRRIGFIGPERTMNSRGQFVPEVRRRAYIQLMQANGLFDPGLIVDCPMDRLMEVRTAKEAMGDFMKSGTELPTALICVNEEYAIGVATVLKENGISIPEDISIISFNDTPRSALVDPPLTSISAHVEEMSCVALQMLAERARIGDNEPMRTLPLKVVVPPSLVIRESTCTAKERL